MGNATNSIPVAASRVHPTYAYNLLYIPQTLFVAWVPAVAPPMTSEMAKTFAAFFSLPDCSNFVYFYQRVQIDF